MEFESFPKISRLSRPITITEKIDGTNAQILIVENTFENLPPGFGNLTYMISEDDQLMMFAGSRSHYLTLNKDNYGFCRWVTENAPELFKLGPGRHFGEWWGKGIQRGYGLQEKRFSLFNTSRWSDDSVRPSCCHTVPVIEDWHEFDSEVVDLTLSRLQAHGSYAAPGFTNPEGVVVYHTAGNVLFKKTIENDDAPKTQGRLV